ncbi:hypothetical protein LARI1_G003817 [Lachnellula arida]|uniref:Heterokaryon incompatibility domain-containing protein n=1 Tax=Lachnellula arida TaxID=1316785 RepID=A0A8T9BBS2_9HELO|nr:hypothetical protein LARI1_G003817 [Lachnellula arida]
MRRIYEQAANVAIWLGRAYEELDLTSLAFNLLQDLHLHISNKKYLMNTIWDSKTVDSLESVANLFNRDYWDRVWIVQEVNSARHITVKCGKYTIPWVHIKSVQEMILNDDDLAQLILRRGISEPRLSGLGTSFYDRGVRAMEIPAWDLDQATVPDIYTLLSVFWQKAATNPRDKVYALIGLSTARDDEAFSIDYSLSVREVYINLVKYLATSRKLDVIVSVPRGSNDFDLPSWVPDWTVSTSQFGGTIIDHSRHGSEQGKTPFSAAGSTLAEAEILHNNQVLKTRGVRLGEIVSVGLQSHRDSMGDLSVGIPVILDWYNRVCDTVACPGDAQVDAFARCIFMDGFQPSDYVYETELELMERVVGAMFLAGAQLLPPGDLPSQLDIWRNRDEDEVRRANDFMIKACDLTACRRWFVLQANVVGMKSVSF